jgi:hypothetical protein
MLDQNTTTVLTTLITVLGTLGGAVVGVVLTNRYTERQEKIKRTNAIIEEVYSHVFNIHEDMLKIVREEVMEKNLLNKEVNHLYRVAPLTNLYLPTINELASSLSERTNGQ